MSASAVTTATVRAGARAGARAALQGPTLLDRAGVPLASRGLVALFTGVAALTLTAVGIPVLATLYAVFLPLAFLVAALQAAALVLAPWRPRLATGLGAYGALMTSILTLGAEHLPGLPWPLPVATLIGCLIVCALIGLRGELGTSALAFLVIGGAVLPPLVVTIGDGDLWATAVANLVTFGCVGVLVTGGALLLAHRWPAVRPQADR